MGASDMVAQMSAKRIASLQEQQPLNDPFNSLLESSLLWLDLPLPRGRVSQPPTPAAKSSVSLALKTDSFKNITHVDTAAMSKAVTDYGKATKARKRMRIEVDETVREEDGAEITMIDDAVIHGAALLDLENCELTSLDRGFSTLEPLPVLAYR